MSPASVQRAGSRRWLPNLSSHQKHLIYYYLIITVIEFKSLSMNNL